MDKLKKAADILSSALLVIFIIFAILIVGVRLFGIEPYIVLSGSMEPEIYTGSLVYVNKLTREEATKLRAGDNVTFMADKNGTVVTHKIYEVVGPLYVKNQYGEPVLDESGNPRVALDDTGYPIVMYTTYGVNNKNDSTESGYTLDGTPGVGNLASSNIIGKPAFSIPLLGYIAHFVQNPPGRYIALIICVLLIVKTFWSPSENKKSEQSKDTADPQPSCTSTADADFSEVEHPAYEKERGGDESAEINKE